MGCKIKFIEYTFAANKIENSHFFKKFPDYNFERFENKVGIKSRYKVNNKENILTLAEVSCNKLIEKNKINRKKIQFLILCTQSPEHYIPSNSCILQNKLSLDSSIGTFDFNLGCSGYVYGLSIAKGLINSGQVDNVLLVTSETYSKYINKSDLINQLIFSDSSSATFIEKTENNGIDDFIFGTDGKGHDKLMVKNNYFNKILNPPLKRYNIFNEYTENDLFMDGPYIFNFTIQKIPILLKDIVEKNKLLSNDIDYYVLHQANKFLLESIRKLSGIANEKFIIDIEDYGNTISSSIPIALKNLSTQINSTKKIILCGFGVGLSWSACKIEIKSKL